MIQKLQKKRHVGVFAASTVVLLVLVTFAVTVVSATDHSATVNVSGLTVTSSGSPDWTATEGGAVWEGTTSAKTGCDGSVEGYNTTSGELVFKNTSGSSAILTFDYSSELNGGSLTVAGASATSGSFNKLLGNNESVTISVTSPGSAATTATVSLSHIKLEAAKEITLTFAAPSDGSYTLNGTAVTANTVVTNLNTVGYSLVATPASGYFFDGWYLGNSKVSESATVTDLTFADTGTVTAKFLPNYMNDPLYKQAKVPADSSKTKDQLVSINTYYLHDTTNKLVADGGFPANNSAYSKTAASKTKDKIDVQYVPFSVWNDSMAISSSGTAKGDYVDGGGQESYAYARVISDVIRIYAKENCNITFNYNGSLTTGGSSETEKNATAYTYTYVTTAANATVAQVKGGTSYTGSGATPTIALSKGNYLYILCEGYAKNRYLNVFGSSQFSMSYNYSASITGFTVSYNEKKDVLTAGFRDNTGKALGSGTISVNNAGQAIGTNGNMADMTFADQAAVTLAVSAAPANYVHIGWEVTPEGGTATRVYTPTYSRTLTENVTVNALFVPKTIITMGANGYSDATYTDASGTALNGQYVARNAGCTAYYTSLADAFSQTDVVVLLAGSTINGDWTIPAGKTFVIPYGMNDAGSTTPVMGWGMGADYCLVNLNGNLNVAGTLLVSALQNQNTGATGGNPGHLVVASGKTLTVSGSLYAYGPVTGAGTVETTSTAQIHETVEFSDNAPVMYVYNIYNERSSKKVFPFNAMFINSIEIPVTYQVGATLTAHAAVRYDTTSTAAVPIIAGSGAMLNHTAGTITKYYDASAGQFVFRFNSDSTVNTGSFSITLSVTVAGRTMDITMNSADYYIPLSAPFRFEVAGNLTINDNYKALPGMTFDVQEGGTLTIASGKNLVLYRRNDYDYRGKHANSTEQWGYGERAYPINPQRFNGVSYPFSFNNSNMGSAKLNVDGTLIVNGGLYVTNEVQTDTANGLTLTADGYNYLTGSGTIDMTNAATSLTEINEVMRAQGTNDLAWDTRAVVPLKGLKADATADEAAQYESLSGVVHGYTNRNGINVWGDNPCAGGHTHADAVEENRIESTCFAPGSYQMVVYCSICGEEISRETNTIEKKAHTPAAAISENEVPATCYAKGSYDEVVYCSVAECKAEISRTPKTSEKIAHTPGKAVRENEVPASCYAEGSYDEVVYCSVEGCTNDQGGKTEISRTPKIIEKTAHTPAEAVRENEVPASCYAEGSYNAVVYCSVEKCGEKISTTPQTIEKIAHTPAEAVRENEVPATCYAEGSYDEVVYCSVEACKQEISRETTTLTKIAHTPAEAVRENEVPATCYAEGSYDEVVYCSVEACKHEISRTRKTIEKTAHTPAEAVRENEVSASCYAEGSYDEVIYCSVEACKHEISREGKTIEKIAHTPAEAVREKEVPSTCYTEGSYEEVIYCSVEKCKHEISREEKSIEKKAHTPAPAVRENEKTATCGAAGSYESVVYCSVVACKAEISRSTETITATGKHTYDNNCDTECNVCKESRTITHDYDAVVTPPTCTAVGYTTYTCKVCSDTYVDDEVPVAKHTPGAPVVENATDATCGHAGSYDEVVYCSVCKTHEISRVEKTVDALPHSPAEAVRENEVAATCHTEGSYDEVVYCSECEHEISRTEKSIDKIAHAPAQAVREHEVAATCHTAGSYDEVVYCSVEACKAEISRTPKTIEKTAHTPAAAVQEDVIPATCYAEGSYNEVVYCSVEECGEKLSSTPKTVEKAEHTPAAAVQEKYKAPTCHSKGSYEEVVYCSVEACKHEISREGKTVEKVDHTPATAVRENVVDSTCYAEGSYNEVIYCSVKECGEKLSSTPKTIEKKEHTPGEAVRENVVDSTCYAEGSYNAVVYCSVEGCGEKLSTTPQTIAKKNHTPGEAVRENVVDSTCYAEGSYNAVVYCSVEGCGEKLSSTSKMIAKKGHTPGEAVRESIIESTCYAEGSYNEVIYCSVDGCGEKISSTPKTIEKTEHAPAEAVRENEVDATCQVQGSYDEVVYCSVEECKHEISREEKTIEKLAHTLGTPVNENVVGETCYRDGSYQEVVYCSVCTAEISRVNKGIPKAAHTDGRVVHVPVTDATCYSEGSYEEVHYCTVPECNQELSRETKIIDKIPHTKGEAVEENRVEPTCGVKGSYEAVYYCTVEECGAEIDRKTKEIPATGEHNYTEVIEENAATCTVNGYRIEKCGTCGHEETTILTAPGHQYDDGVPTPPTCEEDGYITFTCACGDVVTLPDVDNPATNHDDSDGDDICNVCHEQICGHTWVLDHVWLENNTVCVITGKASCGKSEHDKEAIATVGNYTVQITHPKSATCNDTGLDKYVAYFADSWLKQAVGIEEDYIELELEVETPATNHKDTLVQVESKAPTCAEIGYGAYEYCTACDHTTYEEIPPLGHAYEPVVTDPTCSNQGFTTHTCSRCEDSYVDTYVDATGEHIYSDERHYDRRESWKECTGCKGKDDVVARTYNVKIVDYWGNETVREGYTYGQYLWLNYSTSNVLELQYNGWKLVKNGEEVTVPAYEVWESFDIGEDTVDLTVYEDSTPVKVKSGAIMMSVSYDKANSDKTMTVDLFIYVDSLNEAHKPVVKLGETPLTLETIDESIMMYFVSIDLSAQQITQGGDNVKITVNYNDVTVKTIDSVLIAYEEALDTYLQENVGDVAGTAQEEAINAMLNYGKTVQIYFEKTDPNEWGFTGYEPEEIKELADANNNPVAESTKVGDITFTWKGANVKFEEEYSLRYEFELTGLPADVDLAKATAVLTVTYANGSTNEYPVTITSKTKVEDGIEVVVEDRYYATYPVPASDIAKENTTVRMDITLPDGSKVTTSDFKYGMHAFLTYSIYHYTDERDKETGKPYYVSGETNEATREKTSKYVEMLVSLLKLGEAINNVEAMTSNQQ